LILLLNILSGLALLLFLIELSGLVRSLMALQWNTTAGKLKDWDMRYAASEGSTDLVVNKFQYTYSVSGRDYQSRRIGFGFPLTMDSDFIGKQFVQSLENAPDLKVYYNPHKPEESALIVGLRAFHVFKIIVYLIVLGLLYLALSHS